MPYVILVDDLDLAGNIHDGGRRAMVGELDDPDTYRKARIDEAAMVVATRNDPTNTNIAFTVRDRPRRADPRHRERTRIGRHPRDRRRRPRPPTR
ncbi:MAG: NAD-binding protein [Ilumatobacteraceae bacterium]